MCSRKKRPPALGGAQPSDPRGRVVQRIEVGEDDYIEVGRSCVVITPAGHEIVVNEDVVRWEVLAGEHWDEIRSFAWP